MEVKIITPEKAIELGLMNPSLSKSGGGGAGHIYAVVGKKDEIIEVHKINIETKEKEVIFKKEEKDVV